MTKGQLIRELEGLDDDAQIYVGSADNPSGYYNIEYTCDKVTGNKLQNEITLIIKD